MAKRNYIEECVLEGDRNFKTFSYVDGDAALNLEAQLNTGEVLFFREGFQDQVVKLKDSSIQSIKLKHTKHHGYVQTVYWEIGYQPRGGKRTVMQLFLQVPHKKASSVIPISRSEKIIDN